MPDAFVSATNRHPRRHSLRRSPRRQRQDHRHRRRRRRSLQPSHPQLPRRAAPRPRRLPHPHQRAWPHRMGRLRHRHPRRSRRRLHHADRHAAQLPAGDDDRRRSRSQARRRPGSMPRGLGRVGWRFRTTTRTTSNPSPAPASAASNASSPNPASTASPASTRPNSASPPRTSPAPACRSSSTPNCPSPSTAPARELASADWRRYETWLRSRPDEAEVEAIRLMIRLCREYRLPPPHRPPRHRAGSRRSPPAKRRSASPSPSKPAPTTSTSPLRTIADGSTLHKCAPPIRSAKNREQLWEAIREGVIDLIATDHSPCPPEMKRLEEGNFATAWGGIASVSVALSVVWTGMRTPWLLALATWLALCHSNRHN